MENEAEKYGRDSGLQAANWLGDAVRHIEEQFGKGYAAAHPELVAAMVHAAALDYHAGWLGKALDNHGLTVSGS